MELSVSRYSCRADANSDDTVSKLTRYAMAKGSRYRHRTETPQIANAFRTVQLINPTAVHAVTDESDSGRAHS